MIELSPTQRVDSVSRTDFPRDFKRPGNPVIITELSRAWPARRKWSAEYFARVAGEVEVPLYDSAPATGRSHQHAPACRMPLAQYLHRLAGGENQLRLFFFNLFAKVPELRQDFGYPDVGLKFFKKLPVLFMGGKGSRVQLHYDIDLADNVLCHFGGRKRVYLFSHDQTRYLYRVPFSFSALYPVRPDAPDYARFPALKHARGQIAELEHGDVLYIPPGYWHYIIYDDIGFSMSLRAFPRTPKNLFLMAYNISLLRTADGVMRRIVGQAWNARNERRAVGRTHARLSITPAEASGNPTRHGR